MNPRHRRLLIPGLLVALLVVVVVASIAGRSDAAESEPQVVLTDPRITESSGLAVSTTHDDLAYTINDSGNAPLVFAVDLTTGRTVGVTQLDVDLRDAEALTLVDGTLWIADTGDNAEKRDDIALYAIDEPGRASATVHPTRYPISYPGGPANAEALTADPRTGTLYVVTKSLASGIVYEVPELHADRTTVLRRQATGMPSLVTDAAFSPDGSRVALLTYGGLWTAEAGSWRTVGSQPLPKLNQGETVAFVSEDDVLVGSEGKESPLYRLTLDPQGAEAPIVSTVATIPTSVPAAEPTATTTRANSSAAGRGPWAVAIVVGLVGVVAAATLGVRRIRR